MKRIKNIFSSIKASFKYLWDKYLSLFEVIPNKQPSELVLDTSSPFKVVSSLFRGISILIASNAIVFIIISLL